MKETAIQFGKSLDKDQYEITKTLLSEDCTYNIGTEILKGPIAICNSYEQNMLEGKKKMDDLKWGESWIEELSQNTYYVHFTDYLTHKSQKHIHRCKQKLITNEEGLICSIVHIHNQEEQAKLDDFYLAVGIKTQKP